MRWKEIDFSLAIWRIPKTKNGDAVTIPLVKDALTILSSRKTMVSPITPWVFPGHHFSRHGRLRTEVWAQLVKDAELEDFRFHDLRRTMGSWQAMTGASLPIVGKMLGHKSASSTEIYARLTLEPVREAAEKAVAKMKPSEPIEDWTI
jgi:integrase